jgi:hypothetical protein
MKKKRTITRRRERMFPFRKHNHMKSIDDPRARRKACALAVFLIKESSTVPNREH